MRVCATPATWNEGGCHQVPRLPRKVPRRHRRQIRTKRATQYHECHACHAKRRWMWECATWIVCKSVCVWVWVKLVECEWSYCMWEIVRVCVCECVWSYCMLSCVCEVIVCERWYVTKLCVCGVCVKLLYVKFVCVKLLYVRDGMWQSCVCVSVCEVIVC